jgi:hypothetical protein
LVIWIYNVVGFVIFWFLIWIWIWIFNVLVLDLFVFSYLDLYLDLLILFQKVKKLLIYFKKKLKHAKKPAQIKKRFSNR